MEKSRIKASLDTGHKASATLWSVLDEVKELHCPNTTFVPSLMDYIGTNCGECIVCLAKDIMKD